MARVVPGDWFEGVVPDNVTLEEGCHLETSHSLLRFRSRAVCGLRLQHGAAAYTGTMFDVGPAGTVEVGRHALLNAVRIICDGHVEIGDHALLSWNVLLMDSYREPLGPQARRRHREELAAGRSPSFTPEVRPIHIGPNVWIGFDSCILPGVTVGEGAIVGAHSVVTEAVPPYSLVAGNPARVVRPLHHCSDSHGDGASR